MQADLYQKELPGEEELSGCLKIWNDNESGHHLPPYTSKGHFSLPNSTGLSEKPTKPLDTSSNQRVYVGAGTESGELSTLMISEGLQDTNMAVKGIIIYGQFKLQMFVLFSPPNKKSVSLKE